ncbi:MAG: AAA family ATPase [Deltaproteobacteria bacterium]|nr:AAA family ATPase [Deltaproteobacteria bacterium]
MRRDAEKELTLWKDRKDRYPLLIRGARQVGKSYLIETFAKEHFPDSVVINFELQPQLKACFLNLDPQEIINKIQLVMGVRILKEKTLLFLDEIQECPQAIMSLRYFREKMPGLAVIGAGSLLEFALQNPDFKTPVGRIHFLYLEPLSFSEFLVAAGLEPLRQYLSTLNLSDTMDAVIHDKLLEWVRLYLILGGMPAVLKEYFLSRDLAECQHIQAGLLQTYRSDFGKYAKTSQQKYLQKIFDAAPRLVGQRIKYSNIDADTKSRELKHAMHLLEQAGVIRPVYATAASGVPLGAQIKENKFKIIFLDVGLMQNACGLQGDLSLATDFTQINSGSVAEQFAGQELKATADKYQPRHLFFWARDKRGSLAEVDYVVSIGTEIIPVEVKAGKTGKLKSLRSFMQEKKTRLGIRISQEPLSRHDNILSIPFYMVENLTRLSKV